MYTKALNKKGFTLVELIVTLSIVVIVIGAIGILFTTSITLFHRQTKQVNMDNTAAAIDRSIQDYIEYKYPVSGSYLCLDTTSTVVSSYNFTVNTATVGTKTTITTVNAPPLVVESLTLLSYSNGVVSYKMNLRDANVSSSYTKSFTLLNKEKIGGLATRANCLIAK